MACDFLSPSGQQSWASDSIPARCMPGQRRSARAAMLFPLCASRGDSTTRGEGASDMGGVVLGKEVKAVSDEEMGQDTELTSWTWRLWNGAVGHRALTSASARHGVGHPPPPITFLLPPPTSYTADIGPASPPVLYRRC